MLLGHVYILASLFGLLPLALFFVWVFARRRRLIERFAGVEVIERLIATTSRRKQLAKAVGLIVVVGLIIVALARPQWGAHTRKIERRGVDVIIAIDTSRSMLARDIPPDRLTRAKNELRGLIRRLRGDRVGIIPFAGTAVTQCPLTLDYGLAMDVMDSIGVNSVPVRGTAIGAAIRTAVEAFKRGSEGERVLVLLTDGEDQGTDPVGAAREAAKQGVMIYAIGIGTLEGNPIPEGGGHLSDDEGNPVNTRLDAGTLQKVALETGGKYIAGKPGGEIELDEVYSSIDSLQKSLKESNTSTIYEERFAWFLLAAALLLAWEMLQGDRRARQNGDVS